MLRTKSIPALPATITTTISVVNNAYKGRKRKEKGGRKQNIARLFVSHYDVTIEVISSKKDKQTAQLNAKQRKHKKTQEKKG